MKLKSLIAPLLALLLALSAAPRAQAAYNQAELDQMLAPVALYPDPLLSQVLMAATYPLEVVEAARWTRAYPGLKGDEAVRAVQDKDWDPSVKSLVAFPQLLQRMDEQLDWTKSLGDAFLAQEPQVMETVQGLRQRAHAAGNLQSSEYLQVQQQGPVYVVQPVNPQVIYVPYYDPHVVYGPWWWAGYRPVVWAPWPGYVRPVRSGLSVNFWFGSPVGVSLNFFFGNVDWHRRHVHVTHVHNHYYRPQVIRDRPAHQHVAGSPGRWQHNPHHRRGVEYRDASVRQQFAASQTHAPDRRVPDRVPERVPDRPRPQAQPQAQPQPQPPAQPQEQARPRPQQQQEQLRDQRRDQREERREQRREQRDERREDRQPRSQVQPQPRPQVQPQPQPQVQARPRPQVQEQVREARREQREERREQRVERREAPRGQHKGGERG